MAHGRNGLFLNLVKFIPVFQRWFKHCVDTLLPLQRSITGDVKDRQAITDVRA